MITRLSKSDFLKSKLNGLDVTFVWAKELRMLIEERDELLEANTMLKMENIRLQDELDNIKKMMETSTFVRLYA